MESYREKQMGISILLDDDPLITNIWTLSAKQTGTRLLVFDQMEKLLTYLPNLPFDCLFYLDFKLKGEKTGEEIAEELFHRGFKDIYLTTGYPRAGLKKKPWIKEILGKIPPWEISCRQMK